MVLGGDDDDGDDDDDDDDAISATKFHEECIIESYTTCSQNSQNNINAAVHSVAR